MSVVKADLITRQKHLLEAQCGKSEQVLRELISTKFAGTDIDNNRLSKSAFIKAYTSQYLVAENPTIDESSIEIEEDTGSISGTIVLKGIFNEKPIERTVGFLDIWHYNGKTWRLIGSHMLSHY